QRRRQGAGALRRRATGAPNLPPPATPHRQQGGRQEGGIARPDDLHDVVVGCQVLADAIERAEHGAAGDDQQDGGGAIVRLRQAMIFREGAGSPSTTAVRREGAAVTIPRAAGPRAARPAWRAT